MSIKMSAFNDTGVLDKTKPQSKKASTVKTHEEESAPTVKKVKDKTLLERIKETPIVDNDKVNAFKQKLANNHFTINAQSIADKLLSLEDDIFRPLSAKTEK